MRFYPRLPLLKSERLLGHYANLEGIVSRTESVEHELISPVTELGVVGRGLG